MCLMCKSSRRIFWLPHFTLPCYLGSDALARVGYLLFVPDLVSKLITHFVVVLCPAVNGNFVKGFHTSGTDLEVPAKKHSISRLSLRATRPLSPSL